MGISSSSNRWLNRVFKSIAILLVLFAVLLSGFRLFLPYAHNYRVELQTYLNESFDSQIEIGALSMQWLEYGPALIAENVDVLNTDVATIFVKKLELSIDFWASIRSGKVKTHDISLVGATVLFDKTLLTANEQTVEDSSSIDNVSEIFFQQIKRFSLLDSKITIRTDKQNRTFLINKLAWLNDGERHRASGSAIIDGLTSNNFQFNLDVKGADVRDMQGLLYVEANQLNITPWLDAVFAIEDDKTYSAVNFNAWFSIENGAASQLQLALGKNEVSWLYKNEVHSLRLEEGHFLIENLNNPQQLKSYSTPIQLFTNGDAWQPITISTEQSTVGLHSYISSVELFGLADLYPLFSGDIASEALLQELAPVGQVTDVHLLIKENDIQALANFSEITTAFSGGIPGIKNLSGDVRYAFEQVNINLLATAGDLNFGPHFFEPIPYNTLKTALVIDITEQGWQLNANDVELSSEQIHLTADVAVKSFNDNPIEMALLANVLRGDAKYASYYYPHLLMGQDLVDYLNSAIIEGQVEQAQVLFNGPLNKFPFHENEGIFVVDAELVESTFQFDPQWPAIKNFQANLNFTNNSMLITGRGGQLEGVDVTGVETAIVDLENKQVLTVDAQFSDTQPQDVSRLMNKSQMADTVGATLEQLVVSNPISGIFSLNLPLNDIEAVVASGEVYFKHNDVNLQTPEMEFSDVNGTLKYHNDVITTEGINLLWRKMPMAVSVAANDTSAGYYQTQIDLTANWQELAWQKEVPDLLKKYASDELNWQGDLLLKMHHDGDFYYNLKLDSTLENTTLNLPEPFNKNKSQKRTVHAEIIGDDKTSMFNVNLGQNVNFYGLLDHNKVHFTQAHLQLGKDKRLLPTEGFHISTRLEKASISEWQPFVLDIIDSVKLADSVKLVSETTPSNEETTPTERNAVSLPLISSPERIRGRVEQVDVLGEMLSDVSFTLLDQQQWWLLELNAKEARSKVKFYPDWHQQGIEVDADFIHLAQDRVVVNNSVLAADERNIANEVKDDETVENDANSVKETSIDNNAIFENFPPMKVTCGSCRYAALDFGKVEFSIERTKTDLLTLQKFTSERDKTKLNLDAIWQHNQKESQTKVIGQFDTNDLAKEVLKLGYPSAIKDSGIKLKYDLEWQTSPFDFDLAKLNGQINASISDGVIDVDVDDKGVRYLSIFSLSSLARKLKFDFRDVFSEGMFYESIKGDFQLKQGVLYTDNTKMKGGAGDLFVKGNTDLSQQTLDYSMSYKPNVTSSLPALAWVATLNPVTFLAGLAIDGVITSQVISELKFEVTGSMQDPSFKQVDRKTKNIRVPLTAPPEFIEESTTVDQPQAESINNGGVKDHKIMDNLDG
jgi:uncharacterized protein (TIGR02099 family)